MSVVDVLLARHGRTFAEEAGIDLTRDGPAPPFQLLVLALLASPRVGPPRALRATRALIAAGLDTPERLHGAGREAREAALGAAGFPRDDERAATWLGEAAEHVLARWDGDLRRLRALAGGDAARVASELRGVRGVGPFGAGVFLREVQVAWPEVFPYADARTLHAAARLGLGVTPDDLRRHAPDPATCARLAAALARSALGDALDGVRAVALGGRADPRDPARAPAPRAVRAPTPGSPARRRP